MRRSDKAVTDSAAILSILEEARVLHLGFCDGGRPYVVPLSFGIDSTAAGWTFPPALYIHSARAGRKWDLFLQGGEIFFTAYCDDTLKEAGEKACSYSMNYRSVMGTAMPVLVSDDAEKRKAMNLIMKKYTRRDDFSFPESSLAVTGLIRLDILTISGKDNMPR
jgi:nitroimidazol reductase NimA-like FMN-containing flavoprotein (pyridoxamine 5'-phosphate oxidase superfamily)